MSERPLHPPIAEGASPVPESPLSRLKERLREAGLRATAPRIAVLRSLDAAGRPLSHAELQVSLESDGPWDRATLYRNLADLTEVGLLRRLDLGDHVWRFEARAQAEPTDHHPEGHPHFVCTSCGDVQCLDEVALSIGSGENLPKAVKAAAVSIQISGRCDGCT